MPKKLIITEKPSVARQFAQALGVSGKQDGYIEGGDWVITWCVGHLVTLSFPEKYDEELKKWRMETLPFLPPEYKYEVIRQSADQYKVVKSLLARADIDAVYNAGDSGREGEYIQRLVLMMAKNKKPVLRVWIDSQTDAEIKRGIREAKPSSVYNNLSDAAYERAIADYAVGINLSRALSVKYGRAFNAKAMSEHYIPMAVGRVMTCVLGMIVDREREIRNFKPTDYYKINAKHSDWESHWKAVKGTRFHGSDALYNDSGLKNKHDADALVAELNKNRQLRVVKVEKKNEKQQAPAMFNLAELQAECSKRYKIDPSRTLEIAQSLYEKKLTTYPRTDARVLSTAVADVIEDNIRGLARLTGWTSMIDPILSNGWHKNIKSNTRYVDDSKITDHYAIIPTGESACHLADLNPLEQRVYDLISRRFLAVFYPPAEYAKVTVELKHDCGEQFFASEKVLVVDGYKAVYKAEDDDKDSDENNGDKHSENLGLGKIKDGDVVSAAFEVATATTKPPARYNSGSIILAMEGAGKLIDDPELRAQIKGSGIGTSATRAETISKLRGNQYIALESKTQVITPTNLGEILYDVVAQTVPDLLSPRMTASWEKGLSQIESGQTAAADYRRIMEDFVRRSVDMVKTSAAEGLSGQITPTVVGKCPRCGRDVVEGRKGYGCIGYKDEGNKCSFVLWKSNKLLETGKKTVTPEQATELLAGNSVVITGLKSAKTGKKYDGRFAMVDDGEYVKLEMSFEDLPKKRGRKNR